MLFTLEALAAKQGDALLLHWGDPDEPRLAVIDGGPGGVYKNFLKPRLDQLREERLEDPTDPLRIELMMISHIDDDHINGLLQLLRAEQELVAQKRPREFEIGTLWHNSFDDVAGKSAVPLAASLQGAAIAASKDLPIPPEFGQMHQCSALVLASVSQGREVRDAAAGLGIPVNQDCEPLVMIDDAHRFRDIPLGHGLTFKVIGPNRDRVKDYEKEWDEQIKKLGVAKAAEFIDKSIFNLASIIVIAEAAGKRMLLTGDARGDDIMAALEGADLLDSDGQAHFDLIKIPHHGSDHNVADIFFEKITADRYVFSGNGKHGNPEPTTIDMLSKARDGSAYELYFTYHESPRLDACLSRAKSRGASIVTRDTGSLGLSIPL